MSVRRNAIANLSGRAWVALMSFAFVPVYIRLLGIEAFGLIGFFTSMMAVFAVLDLGLGITVNRELSRAAAKGAMSGEARDLFRTLETVYWIVALVIGLVIVFAAPAIVDNWLNLTTLDRETAVAAVRMMGATALLRWPVAIYFGALMGMQQQLRLNLVASAAATLGALGVVAVLEWIDRSIASFFMWQAIVAGCQVVVLRHLAWRAVALSGHTPRARLSTMRATLAFSGGVTGIALLAAILTQLDKLLLSRLLPLEAFGTYALATTIAMVLIVMGGAVESATFPALSRCVAAGEEAGERSLYHRASQGLAVLIVPPAAALVFFAPELLRVYIHDRAVAEAAAPLLRVVAAGNGILGLMVLPLALQLANGWVRLSLVKNVFAVLAFVPVLLAMVHRFGPIGAAWTWLMLTVGYLLIEVPLMHRRLLPGAQWQWYLRDIGIPVVICGTIMGAVRLLLPAGLSAWAAALIACAAAGTALAVSAVSLPFPRRLALSWLHAVLGIGRRQRTT